MVKQATFSPSASSLLYNGRTHPTCWWMRKTVKVKQLDHSTAFLLSPLLTEWSLLLHDSFFTFIGIHVIAFSIHRSTFHLFLTQQTLLLSCCSYLNSRYWNWYPIPHFWVESVPFPSILRVSRTSLSLSLSIHDSLNDWFLQLAEEKGIISHSDWALHCSALTKVIHIR